VLVLSGKYTVSSEIFFKAINWRRAIIFRVSHLKALVSLGGGIDHLSFFFLYLLYYTTYNTTYAASRLWRYSPIYMNPLGQLNMY
jgi:hypothetical protein